MAKYWIYIGRNNQGLIDCKYYKKKLKEIPDHLQFIGTAELKPEFFGERIKEQYLEFFETYAEKYHKNKIIKLFNI